MTNSHYVNRRVLRINVGFLLAEGVGYQRELELDYPRVQLADDLELDNLKGTVRLSRNSRGILIQANLETTAVIECSRCLTPVLVPIPLEVEELFTYPPTDDAAYTVEETGFLDLAPLLREEAIIAMPMGVLCRPDCLGLCLECGHNLNEGPCNCEPDNIDPRFAILRDRLNDEDSEKKNHHHDD